MANSEEPPDQPAAQRIIEVAGAGSAHEGQYVRLTIRMEDGSNEWFDIEHFNIGKFVSAVLFGAQVARQYRPNSTASGNLIPELSTVIDIAALNATALPGEDFICLRLSLSLDVHLDFRIPLEVVSAMQSKIRKAVAVAEDGRPPPAH
ncbi:MAG: hypothetical protein H0U63_04945 [Burkholderiales bacterium]|nr:hypothetical protein [Burkholderiales bacterium]